MRAVLAVSVFVLGVAGGALAAVVTVAPTALGLPSNEPAERDARDSLARLSTSDRGATLMKRVGATFVYDEPQPPGYMGGGWTFYDVPKPYGAFLCRTNRYFVRGNIVTGRSLKHQEVWEDDLTIEPRFGVWTRPSQPGPWDARTNACEKYRDFKNLISEEENSAVARGVYLMDFAVERARTGKMNFTVTCTDYRQSNKGIVCGGLEDVKAIDLKNIRHVEMTAETEGAQYTRRTDVISMSTDQAHKPGRLEFKVSSIQRFGRHSSWEGDVVAIDVVHRRSDWRW